jgi:copper(I)-binding protein
MRAIRTVLSRAFVALGRLSRVASVLGCTTAAALVLAGCSGAASSTAPIKLGAAYVLEADGQGDVDAYLVIRNSGAADHLLRVTSSSGGTVVLRGPSIPVSLSAASVRYLAVPAHSMVRLGPNGLHLVIIGSKRLIPGRYITLTLVFARAGRLQVAAQVTNLLGKHSGVR